MPRVQQEVVLSRHDRRRHAQRDGLARFDPTGADVAQLRGGWLTAPRGRQLLRLHPSDVEGLYPAAGSITPMSALAGFGLGVIMERQTIRFSVAGAWWRRGLRFLVGLIIVAVVYLGPSLIMPDDLAYGLEAIIRFVRYALVGWAVTFLCPWLFVRLGLAGQEEP